jgi:hypothetical protein
LDEDAREKYNCSGCKEPMRRLRNCEGKYEPAKIVVNKKPYSQCPVSIYLNRMDIKDLVDVYLTSRARKVAMVAGSPLDYSNWFYEFSAHIESLISEHEANTMKNMDKDMKKKQKQSGTGRNGIK